MSARICAVSVVMALAIVSCGKSAAPVSPTPSPTPTSPAPPPQPIVLTGHIVSLTTGQPLPAVALSVGGQAGVSDDLGAFRYELPANSASGLIRMSLSGPSILTRDLVLQLPASGTRDVTTDAIALGGGFDLSFYRKLVRDDYDTPGLLRTLRRWLQAPKVYLRTVDEAGTPIEASTIEPVAAALVDDAAAFTGGRFGIASVERGTESREGVSGYITVKWPAAASGTLCGRAEIATNGGWIELYYQNRNCACQSSRISKGTVRHELGHAMGFYHTGDPSDVMYGIVTCDGHASARERLHASIAYGRQIGNADPDVDPVTSPLRSEPGPIVEN